MKDLHEIKKEEQERVNQLITDCRVFFAFSNEQFNESKTPLKEGEKYISMGVGGYIPTTEVNNWINGMKAIKAWKRNEIKANKSEEKEILFELSNYECWYTGDPSPVYKLFAGVYDKGVILNLFAKNKNKYQEQF